MIGYVEHTVGSLFRCFSCRRRVRHAFMISPEVPDSGTTLKGSKVVIVSARPFYLCDSCGETVAHMMESENLPQLPEGGYPDCRCQGCVEERAVAEARERGE